MASGRNVQLARQIGEHLVVAELGRRGWLATPFAGSVPGFDILAVDASGRIIEVQVKTLRSGTWQLNAGHFIDVDFVDEAQVIRGVKKIDTRGRIMVFVHIGQTGGDRFYLCRIEELQNRLLSSYKGGKRPKNPKTLHHALHPKHLEEFRDNWKVLEA
jgi:hypothetical protein